MNPIATFYQKFRSGDPKFTMSTGRFFHANFVLDYANSPLMHPVIGLQSNTIERFDLGDLSILIKNINLPNMKIADSNDVVMNSGTNTPGSFTMPGVGVIEPEGDTFSIDFIPTVQSPVESFFIPWMEEVMFSNSNSIVPFRRANVYIDIFDEQNVGSYSEENIAYTYLLTGVYPNFCDTPNLSHEAAMDNRAIGFKFNTISLRSGGASGAVSDAINDVSSTLNTFTANYMDKLR